MNQILTFLLRHGYTVVFAFVLAEQIGLPVPSTPILLAMGALAGLGRLSFVGAMALGVAASLLADTLWYWLGRKRGYCDLSSESGGKIIFTNNIAWENSTKTTKKIRECPTPRQSKGHGYPAIHLDFFGSICLTPTIQSEFLPHFSGLLISRKQDRAGMEIRIFLPLPAANYGGIR